MPPQIDPVAVASCFAVSHEPKSLRIGFAECLALARVVLAAANVAEKFKETEGSVIVGNAEKEQALTTAMVALVAALEGR